MSSPTEGADSLMAEVQSLRQRVAELEQREVAHQEQTATLRVFYLLVESAPDAIVVTDLQGVITYVNAAFKTLYAYGDASIGMQIPQFFPESEHARMGDILQTAQEHGFWRGVLDHRRSDGTLFRGQETTLFIRDSAGNPQALAALVRDITTEVEAEQARDALQEQVIEAQQAALRELSTPLLPLDDQLLVMPLIGAIDTSRLQQIIETLLAGVVDHQARLVILDITGVSVVDTQVASGIIRAAQAVQLLGAQVVLTGIRPEIAQTLIGLGVNLQGIITRSSLQSGIAYAQARHNVIPDRDS
jgi:rsbT co-antagonist protein RsbR